jgi:hypothetical protein
MSCGLALALLLAGASPEREAARLELGAVASRIELLKVRHAMGEDVRGELHRLLVRAQELAIAIDLMDHPQPPGAPPPRLRGPTPDELHERADAARDQADRLRDELASVDRRIAEVEASARVPSARFAGTGDPRASTSPGAKVAMLEARRDQLLRSLHAALGQAERLEAEARVLESLP